MPQFDVTVHIFIEAPDAGWAAREVLDEMGSICQGDNLFLGAEILDGDVIEVIEDEAPQRKMV